MTRDDIYFSPDAFDCSHCKTHYPAGTLINVFRWDNRLDFYCMGCLQKMTPSNNPEDMVVWTMKKVNRETGEMEE